MQQIFKIFSDLVGVLSRWSPATHGFWALNFWGLPRLCLADSVIRDASLRSPRIHQFSRDSMQGSMVGAGSRQGRRPQGSMLGESRQGNHIWAIAGLPIWVGSWQFGLYKLFGLVVPAITQFLLGLFIYIAILAISANYHSGEGWSDEGFRLAMQLVSPNKGINLHQPTS